MTVKIKVVGPGCANCHKLAALCEEVVTENGMRANIEKVTDIRQFAELGVLFTPGLIINGKLMASGKIPVKSTLEQWIREAQNAQ